MLKPWRIFWLLLLIWLHGCATAPSLLSSIDARAHQRALDDLNQWQIKGRLAFTSPEERFSAYLVWQQDQQDYDFKLNNFVGISLMHLTGDRRAATLELNDEAYQSNNPDQLIYDLTRWPIPLLSLQQWVKGKVKPREADAEVDDKGYLRSLYHKRSGWQVNYQDYRQIQNYWLPHRIELARGEHTVKIRISRWDLIDA